MRVPLDSRVHAAHSSNINYNIRLHSHSIIKFKKTNWIPCSNSSIPVDSDYSNRFYSAEVVLIPTRWTQRHIIVITARIPHQALTLTSSASSALEARASAVAPHLAVTSRPHPFPSPLCANTAATRPFIRTQARPVPHTKRVVVLKRVKHVADPSRSSQGSGRTIHTETTLDSASLNLPGPLHEFRVLG